MPLAADVGVRMKKHSKSSGFFGISDVQTEVLTPHPGGISSEASSYGNEAWEESQIAEAGQAAVARQAEASHRTPPRQASLRRHTRPFRLRGRECPIRTVAAYAGAGLWGNRVGARD